MIKDDYKIVRTLAVLGELQADVDGKDVVYSTELNLISFDGWPGMLDLRQWTRTVNTETPGEGLTLTTNEAAILQIALTDYFRLDRTQRKT